MPWEDRSSGNEASSYAQSASRKFYDYSEEGRAEADARQFDDKEELLQEIADNIIGKDATFTSPFGTRKSMYIKITVKIIIINKIITFCVKNNRKKVF